MSVEKVSVQEALKPKDFIKISWVDKLLPDFFSVFRFLTITDYSVIKAHKYESFVPVDLLRGVDLTKHKFVTLLGVAVVGVWTIPENCSGGATVGLIDTRMARVHEGTICKFSVSASARDFTVKFIPNYHITAADAARNPWKLFIRILGVDIKEGFSPLSLEIAALVATTNSIFKRGLRVAIKEKNLSSESLVSFAENQSVVEGFFDNLPIARSITEFDRSYKRPSGKGDKGRRRVPRPESTSGLSDVEFEDALPTD